MTSEVTKYDRKDFGTISSKSLNESLKEFQTDRKLVTFNKDTDTIVMRVMPPYKSLNGRDVLYSSADMHFNVPVPNPPSSDRDKVTCFCPRSVGDRCLVCENQDSFSKMGVWGDDGQMGCKPTKRIRLNVVLQDAPERGVITFQDGISTLKALASLLEDEKDLLDPFDGAFIRVKKLSSSPWREISVPKNGGWVSMDSVDGFDIADAAMDNLPDLDESWEFPTLEEQYEWFNVGSGSVIDVDPLDDSSLNELTAGPVNATDSMFDDILEDD